MDIQDKILGNAPAQILITFQKNETQTKTEIHKATDITYPHVSNICKKLIDNEFIEPVEDPEIQGKPLTLTSKGNYWADRLSDLQN